MTILKTRHLRAVSIQLAATLALLLAGCGTPVNGDDDGDDNDTTSNVGPVIDVQPAAQAVTEGQTATFSVTAHGTAPLSYQWYEGNTAISGATSTNYTTPATALSDSGTQYSVVVANAVGSVTSSGATLTVNATSMGIAPTITTPPQSVTVKAGQPATFSAMATGSPTPTYQWRRNGNDISGATSTSYTLSSTATTDNGAVFTVAVSNAAGSVTSSGARLTVTAGSSASASWLYTKAPGTTGSNKIYVNDGSGEKVWMGRGVNTDDLFLGCYNADLWMDTDDAETELYDSISSLVTGWKANFIRMSMMMWDSCYKNVSWLTSISDYRDPMVRVVNKLTSAYPNLYIMLTVRTDSTMAGCDIDPDATCVPTTATHAVYEAMVDSFASNPQVMFGLSNEPGGWDGDYQDGAKMAGIMSAAVDTIRAKEGKLGVPYHIVAVQGVAYTSSLGYYGTHPLQQPNVVYEYHNYPPEPTGEYGYTYSNIPVIIGEYAGFDGYNFVPLTQSQANTLYADWETKQISNLGWYFSPFSAVDPAMLNVTVDGTKIQPNSWGTIVKNYLTGHAQ